MAKQANPAVEVQPDLFIERILSMEIARVTERAAVSAARLRGRGDEKAADQAAVPHHCLDFLDVTAAVSRAHPEWPVFRVGVNSGPALIGNIGGEAVRAFAEALASMTCAGASLPTGRNRRTVSEDVLIDLLTCLAYAYANLERYREGRDLLERHRAMGHPATCWADFPHALGYMYLMLGDVARARQAGEPLPGPPHPAPIRPRRVGPGPPASHASNHGDRPRDRRPSFRLATRDDRSGRPRGLAHPGGTSSVSSTGRTIEGHRHHQRDRACRPRHGGDPDQARRSGRGRARSALMDHGRQCPAHGRDPGARRKGRNREEV